MTAAPIRMYDIIEKKKRGAAFTDEEIWAVVDGFTKGDIADYQMASLLMAIYFRGLDERETAVLTDAMAHSGDIIDLSPIAGKKVDKHSTGGVGDKTTLIAIPLVAACGGRIAKMSGRGLGHTGGTIDKLEAIPGYQTAISRERFFAIVKEIGLSVIGQSGNLAPADKKIYALRDVTATVDSLPLIASSIMSKKIAAGSDAILLDVKTGSGALMKTLDDSIALARAMVKIGNSHGRRTIAIITDMDVPLGLNIGNSLEVIEAVATLKGEGPKDLTEVSAAIAAEMLYLSDIAATLDEGKEKIQRAIKDGSGLEKFCQMVQAQGGDESYLRDTAKFPRAPYEEKIVAERDGYISRINAEKCGVAACLLGAGREKKDDTIDYRAGIIMAKKTGDKVTTGETIATLYTSDTSRLAPAKELYRHAVAIEKTAPEPKPLIYARIAE